MGLFKSKEEKELKKGQKSSKKESKVFFYGKTLQPIGKILSGEPVGISLNPEKQILNIHHEKSDVILPYNRVMGFVLDSEDKFKDGGNAGLRALAGGVLFGATGALIGAASAKNKAIKKWIGVLTYKDKNGEMQTLTFLQMALSKPYDGDTKHWGAAQFEKAVNEIASKNIENITEL